MKEILDYGFIAIIFLIITIPLGFLRFKILYDDMNNKKILRIVLIINVSILLLFTVYKFLPKHEVGIDVVINNKNATSEININGVYYYINENEKIKITDINNNTGSIGIKTENNAKIAFFFNEKSIFPFNNKIKIIINNKNIKINSFIKIFVFNNDHVKYDDTIKLLNKK
jgi:hypothetical protein